MFRQPEENPLKSIASILCFSPRDNSANPEDAWLYAIAVGWDDALDDICKQHKWNEHTKQRLIRLREKYLQLEDECQTTKNV